MAITSSQVQNLYVAYLGRAADKVGLDYWLAELNASPAKLTLENLRANFVNEQAEYKAIYGGLTREETVTKIYNNLFGRAPDATGLAYWTSGGGSTVNADQLLVAFTNAASANDAKVLANKVLVSEVYTSVAGTNFTADAAKAAIASVTADPATVGTAISTVVANQGASDATSQAVALLKTFVAATGAENAFETNNVSKIKAIFDDLAKLDAADNNISGGTVPASGTTYDSYNTDLASDPAITTDGLLGAARVSLGGTTAELKTLAAKEVTDLAAAKTAFYTTTGAVGTAEAVAAYEKAAANLAKLVDVDTGAKAQAVAGLQAFNANTANAAAWNKAVVDAGLALDATAAALITAQNVYDKLLAAGELATGSTAAVNKIATAFGSIPGFSTVNTLAATEAAYNVAGKAVSDAATAITTIDTTNGAKLLTAYGEKAIADSKVVSSEKLDVIEKAYADLNNSHDALVTNTQNADTALPTVVSVAAAAGTSGADLFVFGSKATNFSVADSDVAINFGTGDKLYVGDNYSVNTAAKLGTNDVITGGDNNKLEVFFIQDTVGGNVKAVIETNVIGSHAAVVDGAPAVDNVSVIELTGVTNLANVTFANGIISHVA